MRKSEAQERAEGLKARDEREIINKAYQDLGVEPDPEAVLHDALCHETYELIAGSDLPPGPTIDDGEEIPDEWLEMECEYDETPGYIWETCDNLSRKLVLRNIAYATAMVAAGAILTIIVLTIFG